MDSQPGSTVHTLRSQHWTTPLGYSRPLSIFECDASLLRYSTVVYSALLHPGRYGFRSADGPPIHADEAPSARAIVRPVCLVGGVQWYVRLSIVTLHDVNTILNGDALLVAGSIRDQGIRLKRAVAGIEWNRVPNPGLRSIGTTCGSESARRDIFEADCSIFTVQMSRQA